MDRGTCIYFTGSIVQRYTALVATTPVSRRGTQRKLSRFKPRLRIRFGHNDRVSAYFESWSSPTNWIEVVNSFRLLRFSTKRVFLLKTLYFSIFFFLCWELFFFVGKAPIENGFNLIPESHLLGPILRKVKYSRIWFEKLIPCQGDDITCQTNHYGTQV